MPGGLITNLLMTKRASGKLGKVTPELHIEAHMGNKYPGEQPESEYLKEEADQVQKQIDAIQKALDGWIPEDVAARAKKSLQADLASKKAHLAELNARISDPGDEEDDDGEEEDSEDDGDEEGQDEAE